MTPFDWRNPDYQAVYQWRYDRLRELRNDPLLLERLKCYYRTHPADFISDWGMTFDPRNVRLGRSSMVPFVLWSKQREWIDFVLQSWRDGEPGVTEKSRESGVTWLAVGLACTMCLFYHGFMVGFGSRTEEYVDKIGNPKSIFEKARLFLQELPPEFLGGWRREVHAPFKRILFPGTKSAMTGECGDELGRGDRTSIYFVDEAAFLEHPLAVDAALSQTTTCRQDISTPGTDGMANAFARKRFSGNVRVFTFSWREDPRKDADWYAKQCRILDNPLLVKRELDLGYVESLEGILIPAEYVQAAIGAHKKLGIEVTGGKRAALDVADQGQDKNCWGGRRGILIEHCESWSGKGSDIYQTVVRAFGLCDMNGYDEFEYDADGLGAGVRGDANNINERRQVDGKNWIRDTAFRGSGAVYDPEGEMVKQRLNKDFFANLKAQSWWWLRILFQNTHRAVVEKLPYDPELIISIDEQLPELTKLVLELSQPSFSVNTVGKIVINKAPEGAPSPNHADMVMMLFNPGYASLGLWAKLAG